MHDGGLGVVSEIKIYWPAGGNRDICKLEEMR